MPTLTQSANQPTVPYTLEQGQPATTCSTTLYDVIAALQDAAAPGEDDLVVAAMVHLIQSGRLVWQNPSPTDRRSRRLRIHKYTAQ